MAQEIAQSPYRAALQKAVADAYAAAPAQVSPQLEVCDCGCCVDAPTLARMIATPPRDMPPYLVQEYSNSAHGVPTRLADLSAFLPRYLDLMARGEEVDTVGVAVELHRFGDAVFAGNWPPEPLRAAYHDWAAAYLLHCGWIEADPRAEDVLSAPAYLFEMLPRGGIPAALVTQALDDLFALTDRGQMALAQFLMFLGQEVKGDWFDLYALGPVPQAERTHLADWLNALLTSERAQALVTDPDFEWPEFIRYGNPPGPVPGFWQGYAAQAVALGGGLTWVDLSEKPARGN